MPHRLLITWAVLLAFTAQLAHADDSGVRAAKRHFERGEKLYALTRFKEALDEYQQAFDAKPIADFLFNIGQCYRNLGDYDSAIFSYQKYLKLAPEASNREQVELLIHDLEAKQQTADSRRLRLNRPAEPAPEPASGGGFYTRWWFWTGLGVLAAAGGVGLYEATKSSGPPSTGLGNIVFGK